MIEDGLRPTPEESQPSAATGRIFIISAPSGAGKTTLCRRLLERLPSLQYSVSTTTRRPRPGEVQGRDYYFTDAATFRAGIQANRWAEWAEVHGNYYGTAAAFIDRERAAGHDILLDIDVQGAAQLRARYPEAVSIFIMPPSLAVLQQRLEQRGADAPEVIAKRMANARQEMAQRAAYQHTVVNDRLEAALAELIAIIAPRQADGEVSGTGAPGMEGGL
jgi:guanylate kinase